MVHQIARTTPDDIQTVFTLFDNAVAFQKANGYPDYSGYDKEALQKEIANGHQYKILIDDKIALVFSVIYSDKVIWRDADQDDAIYLHRIIVNREFKGQKLFSLVLEWARAHAKERGRKFIRMDTWASSKALIQYYSGFGFRFVGNYTTPDSPELPRQNRKLDLALLEMGI